MELTGLPASEAKTIFARFDDPAAFAAPKFQQLADDSKGDATAIPWSKREPGTGCKPA